jgi:hypothetical protein
MANVKRLLILAMVTAALVGMSVPAGADRAARPVEGAVAVEGWGPVLSVPMPRRRAIQVLATAISDRGQIAVAYRDYTGVASGVPGFVIVRGRGGGWSAPHRLNSRGTHIESIEVAFDAGGNLTAAWSFVMPHGECCGEPMTAWFDVASKPAGHRWSAHQRVGRTDDDGHVWDSVLSVAPSGKAVFFWWRARELESLRFNVRFMVRVRSAADALWGPARALSRAISINEGNRSVDGDVAINNDGTGMAAWTVNAVERPSGQQLPGPIRRSALGRSGAWTAPIRIGTNLSVGGLELASEPNGFTAIKWLRRDRNGATRTVVAQTAGRAWLRSVVGGAHGDLAVGRDGTVAMVKLPEFQRLLLTWHSSRSRWRTDTLTRSNAFVVPGGLTVDTAGRIVVLWSQPRNDYMARHLGTWDTTAVWDRARHDNLAAAAVSPNGRVVAIATVTNTEQTRTTATMRVFRPG